MNGFNNVTIAGNLTRDPELRYTPKGTAVCKFGLAINRQWKDESGAKKEAVTFIDVQAWSGAAETIAQYCKKGRPLLVSGRLDVESWEDKETKKERSKVFVTLENFIFIPDGKGNANQAANGREEG